MQISRSHFHKYTMPAIGLTCLILLLIIRCSPKELPEEKTLFEESDDKGRVLKKVVTGRIPGEDIFLTITQFDTSGKVIAEYGAKPYGVKFKSTFKYDNHGRTVEEVAYNFLGGQNFEHYKSEYELYSLLDTIADFENTGSKTKIVYEYNEVKGLTMESHYLLGYDSLKGETLKLLSDTTYRSRKDE